MLAQSFAGVNELWADEIVSQGCTPMQGNRAFDRGAAEAREGIYFDPSFFGYARLSREEYDYARGYVSENDLREPMDVILRYEAANPIPKSPEYCYEEDGNILRRRPNH